MLCISNTIFGAAALPLSLETQCPASSTSIFDPKVKVTNVETNDLFIIICNKDKNDKKIYKHLSHLVL